MKIKKYEAKTMKEALEMIRNEMGPDAFVLSTKQIEKPGKLGIGNRTVLQVVAAFEESPGELEKKEAKKELERVEKSENVVKKPESPKHPKGILPIPPGENITETLKNSLTYNQRGLFDEPEKTKDSTPSFTEPAPTVSFSYQLKPIKKELMEIKSMISTLKDSKSEEPQTKADPSIKHDLDEVKHILKSLMKSAPALSADKYPTEYIDIYNELTDNDVSREIASNIVMKGYEEKKKNPEIVKSPREFVRHVIQKSMLVSGPVQLHKKNSKVLAVFGPTGVGKTTTIAKLAAYSTLNLNLKVALITMDTFRLAAVEQLTKFADILDAPVNVALSAVDLHNAINYHKDRALILIDTPGMSHKDSEKMNELLNLLNKEECIEKHLAVSATTKQKDVTDIIEKFSLFEPDHMIFTKVDESSSYGALLNQMVTSELPVSYITNGQNVPDDIEIATRDRLADLILPAEEN